MAGDDAAIPFHSEIRHMPAAALQRRPWVPAASEDHVLSIAADAASRDAAGVAAEIERLVADNHRIHDVDGLNLNQPVLKYYGINTDQPRAFYDNGRQYYFGVRMKF